MTNRQAVATETAAALFAAEAAIDEAIARTGAYFSQLPSMRIAAGLSAVAGQGVFASAAQAGALLAGARGAVVESHNELEALRRAMRLERIVMEDAPPGDKPFADARRSADLYEVTPTRAA